MNADSVLFPLSQILHANINDMPCIKLCIWPINSKNCMFRIQTLINNAGVDFLERRTIYKRNPEMTFKTLAQDCVYSNPLKLNYIHTCLNRNSKNTRGCCGTNQHEAIDQLISTDKVTAIKHTRSHHVCYFNQKEHQVPAGQRYKDFIISQS